MSKSLKLACLISGGGRTLMNIADRIDDGSLDATVAVVISSSASAAGVTRARDRGFDVHTVLRGDFADENALHDHVTKIILDAEANLACMCGYLRLMRVDPPLQGRVINIHPALLPAFGGKGMYGHHVHEAVLEAGKAISGCTIHFVDEHYDHGPIILQRTCPVLPDDDADRLAARVFEQECRAYPEVLRLFSEERVKLIEGRTEIIAGKVP